MLGLPSSKLEEDSFPLQPVTLQVFFQVSEFHCLVK